jgi:EAL domain-containing protein (putative c-di-GMP-specific phosphodiesterase class I)
LLSYEPDILKIDGSLIKNIHNNQINQHIVETVMLFAKKQNLSTVAEFVENETIYEIVRDMGIDYSQGFYFGKPEMF